MAITINRQFTQVPGARKFAFAEITLENPYVAGGYALQPSDLGLNEISHTAAMCTNSPLYNVYWDQVNKKFLIAVSSTGAQAGAIDLSAVKVYLLVVGR